MDPHETIQVDATKISYKLDHASKVKRARLYGLGQIESGNWESEQNLKPVDEVVKIKGLIQRFDEQKSWSDTEYYDYLREKYKKRKHDKYGFESCNEYLSANFEAYESLYQNIKENGYIEGHDKSRNRPGSSHPIRDQLEVLVAIGHNGDIYFWDGHHRFAVARVLEIDIPVQVVCRHRQWQELRDTIHTDGWKNDYPDRLRNHPDLQDLSASIS